MARHARRAPFAILCARLTLAAFAATLPGPAAWAQAASRVAPIRASGLGISGAAALSVTAPLIAIPALTPATLAVPLAAPAAAPLAARVHVAVVPVVPVVPVAAVGDGDVSAKESLQTAVLEMAKDGGGKSGARNFDGDMRGGAAARGDGDGKPKSGPPALTEAPILALTKLFFPGFGATQLIVNTKEAVASVSEALRGGYMIASGGGRGTMGTLMRISFLNESQDGAKLIVFLEALRAVKITGYGKTAAGVPTAKISYPAAVPSDADRLKDLGSVAQHILETFASLDPEISPNLVGQALAEKDVHRLANLLAQEMPFSVEIKQKLLAAPSLESRLESVVLEMMGRFNKQSAAAPGAEDGAPDDIGTLEGLKAKMRSIGMPDAIQAITLKEFDRFSKMEQQDAEAQKLRTYLEWLTDVPWSRRTQDNFDLARAREILERDHAGLEKVKERVLEFLALRKRTGSKKGAILAFTGPPGVGKTSIARAIAEALGRSFVRLSLGGVHDESVLRGHRRTYQDSMPGRVIQNMKTAGTVNPVMLLDEVDKIGRGGNQGDPTAALLEILDPAQNDTFHDHYLNVPYDLSEVLFVVTSNQLDKIPEPLRDRMEIIEFDGYTTLEKIQIAEKHVVPEKLKLTGLQIAEASLTRGALRRIVEGYTMEAGVRGLRENIEAVLRKIAAWIETRGEKVPGIVDADGVQKYLGVPPFSLRETAQNGVGVATGLGVNAYGGSTLNVEVSKEPGSGQLKLRKQFGDDIEDSAKNAYKYVKTHAASLGLKGFDFTKIDVDINITPAGKIDGPSAGGLMVTAIVSALTGRPVKAGVAMTGEITMRGDILPIGGLKQKVMAAHRMGYAMVIFPFANLKDIENIPAEVREGIVLKDVKTYDEIYPAAIEPEAARAD
ncbi:MAG: endopeptidase La [Elusimicrobia bacterium GWC2_65_9]|nr:MAG: endopeptidase La [Elusimicrobia bacterium GWA2_66_18]OGR68942.1 MAG: endopeptidase La [Elusimicrobia bacterium GWC2_65_9]